MEKSLLAAVLIFCALTFLYYKLTYNYGKKEYGKLLWKQWGTKAFYWSGAFFICGGLTVGALQLLNHWDILAI